jgi:hypothetical protein
VMKSASHPSDNRMREPGSLWKIFSSMTQAKKRMKREAHSTA